VLDRRTLAVLVRNRIGTAAAIVAIAIVVAPAIAVAMAAVVAVASAVVVAACRFGTSRIETTPTRSV
jgi:ABC-type methionine transport system permease subunit